MRAFGGRGLTWILIRLAWMSLCVTLGLTVLSIVAINIIETEPRRLTAERANLDDLARRLHVLDMVIAYRETIVLDSGNQREAARRVNLAINDTDRRAFRRPNESVAVIAWSHFRNDWNVLQRHADRDRVERVLDDAQAAVVTASEDTELANDRDRAVRNLLEVAYINVPELKVNVHRLTDSLIIILNGRELTFRERVHSGAQLTVMQTLKDGVSGDLALASRADRTVANSIQNTDARVGRALGPYFDKIEAIVTEDHNLDRYQQRDEMKARTLDAIAGLDDVTARSDSDIVTVITRAESIAYRNLLLTKIGLTILWALALYGLIRYVESLKERARELEEQEVIRAARITDELNRRNTEIALGVQTQMFQAVFERAPVGIATIDARGDIHQWNPELQRFLSDRRTNLIGDHLDEFRQLLQDRMPLLAFERSFRGPFHEERWASLIVSRIYDDGSNLALCMVQDITQKRQSEARLRYEAMHDGLTGLANRRLFRAELGLSLDRHKISGESFAVLFIDLDLFKYVNDTFGHAAGDFVLKTVAERLSQIARTADLAARFGGDEFAMLIEAPCEAGYAESIGQAITDSLAEPIFWEEQQVNIGSSLGLIHGPGPYVNAEEMMRNADTAMYAAKSEGRGRYIVFDPSMQDAAHQRAQLSNDLQSALSDVEQIHVLYQPIVSIKDNAIMGFEALARWRHPQFGDIGPDEFVKIAEQSGAIRQLGRSVMRKAFTQLTKAGERLPDLSRLWLSVNLSPLELSAPDFVESVAAAIRETDFDPSRLYLEITESRVIDSGDQANRILARLREFGIRVSIDDFGAGYSSLRYLQELDLDLIKIDKGFLKQTADPGSRQEILRAIVALASAFGLPVCAEGVETPEQLRLVRAIGFQYAQGRIWGTPMSIDEIEARFSLRKSYVERDHP